MGLQLLHPDEVRDLLRGYESSIPALAEEDSRQRAAICDAVCPQCGEGLTPHVPSDPARVFARGGGIHYDRRCPTHGVV